MTSPLHTCKLLENNLQINYSLCCHPASLQFRQVSHNFNPPPPPPPEPRVLANLQKCINQTSLCHHHHRLQRVWFMGEKAAATAHSASCLFQEMHKLWGPDDQCGDLFGSMKKLKPTHQKVTVLRQIMNFDFFFNLNSKPQITWTANISCSAPT